VTEPAADDSAGVKGGKGGEPSGGGAQSYMGATTDALAAFGSALVKAAKTKPSSAADQTVSAAFALGWHMSELQGEHSDSTQLPGLSKLSKHGQLTLTVTQVMAGVNALKESVAGAGLDPIDLTDLKGLIQKQDDPDPVHETHVYLLTELTAADPRLGKAYGLGRALADSCHEPDDFDGLKKELNPYRIANLLRWLDDLASAFPPHAAHSVETSLTRWRDALYPPNNVRSRGGIHPWTRIRWWRERRHRPQPISDAETDQAQQAVKTLRRQGELWRALLSGEKACSDMLEIDNYLDAGKQLVHSMAVIARRAILRNAATHDRYPRAHRARRLAASAGQRLAARRRRNERLRRARADLERPRRGTRSAGRETRATAMGRGA
jgi:hypothetical protein